MGLILNQDNSSTVEENKCMFGLQEKCCDINDSLFHYHYYSLLYLWMCNLELYKILTKKTKIKMVPLKIWGRLMGKIIR